MWLRTIRATITAGNGDLHFGTASNPDHETEESTEQEMNGGDRSADVVDT
jgi:hypothetical protein